MFNGDDEWHDRAMAVAADLGVGQDVRFVTTLLVLEEFLTDLAKRDSTMKDRAATFVERILHDPLVEVIEIGISEFNRGLALYRHRLDKAYSMVDCISMTVCRERAISEVLTADRDFERKRFIALLRREP